MVSSSERSGRVESRLLRWYQQCKDRQLIGEAAADDDGPPELWELALFVLDKTGLCFQEVKERSRLQGDKNVPKAFPGQDKRKARRRRGSPIPAALYGESSSSPLVGRNTLNVSVCLGILFPGGLI